MQMNGLTTWDLGILENSYEFMEDLPEWPIWNVELQHRGDFENFYFRSEKNARAKFDELVKKYDLKINGVRATNWMDIEVWIGKLVFDD